MAATPAERLALAKIANPGPFRDMRIVTLTDSEAEAIASLAAERDTLARESCRMSDEPSA